VVCVAVSAKEKKGINDLLENLLVVAEMEELKADPSRPAVGVVVEAKLDKSKGPLATVLVQTGTLKLGDAVAVGGAWGRVRAMFNDLGKRVRKAEPSTPVEILGLDKVPQAGDILNVVAGEQQARALIQKHQKDKRARVVSLDNLYDQLSAGQVKELDVILKVDVQGSLEPITTSLERLSTDQVKVRIIHSGSGNITESDVMLAVASKGLVIGFGNKVEAGARRMADAEGVDIHIYDIIYDLVDDVEKALKGMLEPHYVDVIEGRAEIRAVFPSGKKGKVAGVMVIEGKISRGAQVRVRRKDKILYESVIESLRRFKDDVSEVATGYECGVGVKDFEDFEVGDILEFFRKEKA